MPLPVLLWSDALMWLLVAIIALYAWYSARRPHLSAPWLRVFRSKAGLSCAILLAVYGAIGLSDSIHFRQRLEPATAAAPPVYAPEVFSALDFALSGLRERRERTYSAPLATRLYAKEQVQVDGKPARDFPRLRHGGAHLKAESDHVGDVFARVGLGLLAASFAAIFIGLAVKRLQRRRPAIPWRSAGWTVLVLLAVAFPVMFLAQHYHVLGTDKVGNDVLYQALKSVRTSMVIGTLTTLVLLPVGVALGLMAGYFKGWVDDFIQYVYTTISSIPGVLLIVAAVLMMQVAIEKNADLFPTAAQRADVRLLVLCAILGLVSWTGLARLMRGEALKLSQLEFVQAAHAFGVRHGRILSRHLLSNVTHLVVITVVMDFSALVLAEAVLSYIGVGVDPSTISFGTMINSARLEMGREPMVWWSLAAAFAFMLVLVLAANLFGDAVRDGFDPRVRIGGVRT